MKIYPSERLAVKVCSRRRWVGGYGPSLRSDPALGVLRYRVGCEKSRYWMDRREPISIPVV